MGLIVLVRHGQASFGTDDYDRLSPSGLEQSRLVGASLAEHGIVTGRIVSGTMRRHQETAAAMIEGAGWQDDVRLDPAWDEFDVMTFLQVRADGPSATDSRVFQDDLDDGMRRWADGVVIDDAGERFSEFTARVEGGLEALVADHDRSGPVVVATSAGAISWAATSLLGGGVEQWIRLNRVCVNAAVTRVVHGRGGLSLVSFNEHGHFSPSEVTYR